MRVLNEMMEAKLGIKKEEYNLNDGCGGSRYNLVKPSQLARLLFVMNQDKTFGPMFKESMAVSGQSGTLKERMKSPILNGRIVAKTGTLSNASTLAGYLTTEKNQKLIFVIMVNNILEETPKVETTVNEFLELLVQDK